MVKGLLSTKIAKYDIVPTTNIPYNLIIILLVYSSKKY